MKRALFIGSAITIVSIVITVFVVFPWATRPSVDVAVISELPADDVWAIARVVENDLALPGRTSSIGDIAGGVSKFVDKVKGDSWPKIYLRIDSRPIAATEVSANVVCGGADCDYEMRYKLKKGSQGWAVVGKSLAPGEYIVRQSGSD